MTRGTPTIRGRLTRLAAVARFLAGIYLNRARMAYWARLRGDLLSRLVYPGDRTDPYELYEALRAKGPIVATRLGNYATTSHRLCNEVLRNRNFGVTPDDGTTDQVHGGILDLSLLTINPPDHTRIRRLAAPAFTPRRMSGYVPLVEAAIGRLLDDCERQGEFDLVASFASPLPIAVVTQLLGLPDEPVRLRRLGSTIAQALDGIWSLNQARILAAADTELREMFAELIARRVDDPGDDLLSALVPQRGEALTESELSALVRLLLIAGFETTVNAIGNGMRWLLADREQWRSLVADPDLAESVADEVLRFDPPVQQTIRVAQRDIELGGVLVRRNEWVLTLLAAGNRDPQVFSHPNHFDIGRAVTADHLAFSGGVHYCLGSALARMELAQAFRALAIRFPDLQPAGPVEMRRGTTLRGPRSFPVRVGLGRSQR